MVSTIGIGFQNLFCPEGAEHTPSLQDESSFIRNLWLKPQAVLHNPFRILLHSGFVIKYNMKDINTLYLKLTALDWHRFFLLKPEKFTFPRRFEAAELPGHLQQMCPSKASGLQQRFYELEAKQNPPQAERFLQLKKIFKTPIV